MANDAGFSVRERFRCSGATVVPVHGEIDLATADHLRDRLLRTARHRAHDCLVVDMSGLDFFDASGVRSLVAVHHELTRQGRHLALAEPAPVAARVIQALELESLFEVYPVVRMARAHADGRPVHHAPDTGCTVPGTS
ncbi:STAS domain-containing protein [Nocardiopsis kunsanensis]|uniref:Anti-sigma factor antagonist n=1 Tax=Nocardiopsis kunsanensis TaxID=141693 RepID=A0A918X9J9_9ACTN|nr:STAS domain-containing protein [Nocardiopsis kunsanensis]GHD19955.1 anti-sigma factor antagonist [Nocardiopsis kunsanensis]